MRKTLGLKTVSKVDLILLAQIRSGTFLTKLLSVVIYFCSFYLFGIPV